MFNLKLLEEETIVCRGLYWNIQSNDNVNAGDILTFNPYNSKSTKEKILY